jgi:hypothetical protein
MMRKSLLLVVALGTALVAGATEARGDAATEVDMTSGGLLEMRPKNRFHVSIGGGVAPIGLYSMGDGRKYVGISGMPEFGVAWSISNNDAWRLKGAVRWPKYSALTTETPVEAHDAAKEPILIVGGVSARVNASNSNTQTVATAVQRVSFLVGYGNLPTSVDANQIVTGFVVMVSLDIDLLSYNF